MGDEREILTWEGYGEGVIELARAVYDSGFRPDLVLAIARGGLFVAGSLGYALGVKNLYVMNMEFYTGVDERLEFPVMLPPYLDKVDLRGTKVLVADDVADTGATLKAVHDFAAEEVAEVRSAVLYEKPQSSIRCDYVWKRTDRWIVFPWSDRPTLAGDASEL